MVCVVCIDIFGMDTHSVKHVLCATAYEFNGHRHGWGRVVVGRMLSICHVRTGVPLRNIYSLLGPSHVWYDIIDNGVTWYVLLHMPRKHDVLDSADITK